MSDAARAAVGRWHGILRTLGIPEEFLRNRHGPCPMCQGKDRFRFDDKEGKGTYYCGGCGAGDGFTLLQNFHNWDFAKAAKEVERIAGVVKAEAPKPAMDKRERLRKIAKGLVPVTGGDPVSMYLLKRGLAGAPTGSLRLHPKMPYYDGEGVYHGHHPSMVAALRSPDGQLRGLHITYLNRHGHKAEVPQGKRIYTDGQPVKGAAIPLSDPTGTIGIAEGIETAFSAWQLDGIPCWAASNTSILAAFEPPEGITGVIIYGDFDLNFAGHAAAYALAHRLALKGYMTDVRFPSQLGDFNDELKNKTAVEGK